MSTLKRIKLENNVEIPTVGLGTYRSLAGQVEEAVKIAIDVGYRHFDCAWYYGNELEVGRAIRDKICSGVVKREDLFITSKLWNNYHAKSSVVPALQESLKLLNLDYLDLYLVHWPMAFKQEGPLLPTDTEDKENYYSDIDYLETWEGMEQAKKLGFTKSIGVSNFNSEQIDRLYKNCTLKPVVNQIECNPNINQKKLIQFCKERGITIVGFCPLGRPEYAGKSGIPNPTILDPKLAEIGKKYNKTPAQIVLNYLVNNLGIVAIPKSVTPSRIKENFEIYDFTLDDEDVNYLDSCNKNVRVSAMNNFTNHKYYPFHIEF